MTNRQVNVTENEEVANRKFISRVRMSTSERKAIEYVAGIEGVKFSEALRMLIREALKERGVFVGKIDKIRNGG